MCLEGLQRSMLLVNGLWDFLSVYCISFTVDFLDEYEAAQNDSMFTDNSNWSPSSWHRYESGWQERVAFMHTGFWQKSGLFIGFCHWLFPSVFVGCWRFFASRCLSLALVVAICCCFTLLSYGLPHAFLQFSLFVDLCSS